MGQGRKEAVMKYLWRFRYAATALLAFATADPMRSALACTRAMYVGPDGMVITTRSNDWLGSQKSNLWIYPRGMPRFGDTAPDAMAWTSKYGSITVAGWDMATIDGMNEKGLAANALYLAESDYGTPGPGDSRKPMSLTAWVQYSLDNFATVAEAVDALRAEPFYIIALQLPGGLAGVAHLSLSDPTGDSAIFEYIKGKLVIHHGNEYKVMTNSPTFDKQLGLNGYWQEVGGETFLPGTNRASDRFVRASYYMETVKKPDNTNEALATALSVIRNASVPVGITTPGKPNIAATQWRTMSDQRNLTYFFESAFSPYLLWIDLKKTDFSEGAPVKKLALTDQSVALDDGKFLSGEVSAFFKPAKAFEFGH
jgi:penicillin V acylase-like amidase (Ntn superfamily)